MTASHPHDGLTMPPYAAQPDPYAETVRLLPADTFTQQTRDDWIDVGRAALVGQEGTIWSITEVIVDALLAHLAAQQPRPMPGGDDQ